MGREMVRIPACPFCETPVERPKELSIRRPSEMPVGVCSCGAVYTCDVTGHSLGSAMVEALVFACNGDWDLAWDLLPEEDYLQAEVRDYDFETHLTISRGVYQGRRVAGVLFFIKLHEDVREVTESGVRRQFGHATPERPAILAGTEGTRPLTKREVEDLVKGYRLEPLMVMARQDKGILRDLQRLLYSADDLLRFRAADVIGQVCAVIAGKDPGTVSRFLQRLLTSITDTAASSWGALDAIGEIIGSSPDQFAGYIPELYSLMRDKVLSAGVLRALARIARSRPHLIRKHTFRIIPLLKDPNPEVRASVIILVGNLGAKEATQELEKLLEDTQEINIYENGRLEKKTVGQLASDVLEKVSGK